MADQPSKPKKRRVKNPESFRERALKAAQDNQQPKRRARLKRTGAKAIQPVVAPAGRTFRKAADLKPLRWLRKPLRFIGKIIVPVYFRQSWQELRQVTWPNWKQSRQLTYAVLVFAVLFGAAVALVDWGLDKLFRDILLK